MSLESLRFMMGGAIKKSSAETVRVYHTAEFTLGEGGKMPDTVVYTSLKGVSPKDAKAGTSTNTERTAAKIEAKEDYPVKILNLSQGWRTQITSGALESGSVIKYKNPKLIGNSTADKVGNAGDQVRVFWAEDVTSSTTDLSAVQVTISPETFPGSYKVIGDTFIRSEKSGKDEPFQFIIEKASVQSSVTLSLEAEGKI